jgi:hypothetical protein
LASGLSIIERVPSSILHCRVIRKLFGLTTTMATDIDQSRRNKKPRLLQEGERARLDEFVDSIGYSAR